MRSDRNKDSETIKIAERARWRAQEHSFSNTLILQGTDQVIEGRAWALISLFLVNLKKLSLPGEYISHEI